MLKEGEEFSNTKLKKIGKDLFSKFKTQSTPSKKNPDQRKQFCVVYLASSIADIENLDKNMTTDNTSPVYPPDNNLSTYLTARPHRKMQYKKWIKKLLQLNQPLNAGHAEFLMMKKFKLLVQNYNKSVKYIILYSYLLPCKLCASVIVDTIQSCYSAESKPLTCVLYSGKRKQDLEKDSIEKMKSNGIRLQKIYVFRKKKRLNP